MIDIDHFKRFNDDQGHEVGDQVLRQAARVPQGQTRRSDVAARYGGEEFTAVLPDRPSEHALARAEQIRAAVENLAPNSFGTTTGAVTVSIGLAQFPTDGHTVEALLRAADRAVYESKRTGRHRVVVASSARAVSATKISPSKPSVPTRAGPATLKYATR